MSDWMIACYRVGDLIMRRNDCVGLRSPKRNLEDTFTVLDANILNYVEVLNNRSGERSFMHVSVIKRIPL